MFSLQSYRKGNQKISLEQKQNIATFLMNILSEKQHMRQKKISKPVLYYFGFFQIKSRSQYKGLVCLHHLKEEVQMTWKYCHSQEGVKLCMRPSPWYPVCHRKMLRLAPALVLLSPKPAIFDCPAADVAYVSEELNNFYNSETDFFS